MATTTLPPDAIISSTNLTGAVTDIDDPVVISFTPAAFPSVTAWWDADDLSGLTDGNDVTSWTDRINGYVFDQRVAGTMPDKETTSTYLNVDFLASNSESLDSTVTSTALLGNTPLLCIVLNLTGNPATTTSSFYANDGIMMDSGGYCGMAGRTNLGTPVYLCGIYDGAHKGVELTATPGNRAVVLMYRTSGGTLTASLDGGTESTLASGAPQVQTGTMRIGCEDNAQFFLNGRIYSIVAATDPGTSGDRTSLVDYLKTKWGVT